MRKSDSAATGADGAPCCFALESSSLTQRWTTPVSVLVPTSVFEPLAATSPDATVMDVASFGRVAAEVVIALGSRKSPRQQERISDVPKELVRETHLDNWPASSQLLHVLRKGEESEDDYDVDVDEDVVDRIQKGLHDGLPMAMQACNLCVHARLCS